MSGYELLRCSSCSAIIGVYEPLVVRMRDEDRVSSLAAEPALPLAGAEHLHLACAQDSPSPCPEGVALAEPTPPVKAPAPPGGLGGGNGRRQVG